MRILLASLFLLGTVALVFSDAGAGEPKGKAKEVTLKGKITCGKCDLSVDDACATVIVVKKDKKEIVYYFDAAGHKAHHGEVCTASKPGSVVGTVSKKGEKNYVMVKKVTFE